MKFTFFALLLTFAVFLNSIELGRSQQRDPELSSSDDERPTGNRGRNAQSPPHIPEGYIPLPSGPVHPSGIPIPPFSHQGPGPHLPPYESRLEAPTFSYGPGTPRSQRRHQPRVRSQGTQILPGNFHHQVASPPAPHPTSHPPRGPPPPQQ